MCGSRKWYLGVVSFRAWRALILWYASTNIRLTAILIFPVWSAIPVQDQ